MSALYCGIDPGIRGGIGFVDGEGLFHCVYSMPVLETTTKRMAIDAHALTDLLVRHGPRFSLIEKAGARPGEGAVGAFAFGQGFGVILGIMAAMRIPYDLIAPNVWKRRIGIPPGADKPASIALAKRLLPHSTQYLTRVKDEGRAEALLLARLAVQASSW